MNSTTLRLFAERVRTDFETRNLDLLLLQGLYQSYHPVPRIEEFIASALDIFPRLNCGVASVYMRHLLASGTIIQGAYGSTNHSFLQLSDGCIIDITADQFGGPRIYAGTLRKPWSLAAIDDSVTRVRPSSRVREARSVRKPDSLQVI